MSDLIVQPAVITAVREHPNADKLEVIELLGWQLVVAKDLGYEVGQTVVYVPPDSCLTKELADSLGVTQYLSHVKSTDRYRVKAVKLRGELSFGLLLPMPVVLPGTDERAWEIGENVAECYDITKFEPPIRPMRRGENVVRAPEDPRFTQYTSIENLRNYPDMFTEGEPVVITEKIHGCNVRVGVINGELFVGSRKMRRGEPADDAADAFWFPLTIPGVRELLDGIEGDQSVILFGETFGPTIQSLHYGLSGNALGFRAFDIMANGTYLNPSDFEEVCYLAGIDTAPVLYDGLYSRKIVQTVAEGVSTLDSSHMREGVVVRPQEGRTDPRYGRVIGKYLSNDYLLSRNLTDYTEE